MKLQSQPRSRPPPLADATASTTSTNGRRVSAAASVYRAIAESGKSPSAHFWDAAVSDLAVGQLSIYDFDPAAVNYVNARLGTTAAADAATSARTKADSRLAVARVLNEEMVHSPTTPQVFGGAVVAQPAGYPKQARIDGEVWPPIFSANAVRSAKLLEAVASDVFVVTYPKCGTTWVQHICSQLLNHSYEPNEGKELCVTSPMVEKMGADYVNTLKHPRLLKTHFSYANCPNCSDAKYIYTVRNPKDCLTSYYFHNKNFKIYNWANGDFDVFFELFVHGELGFGDYFDHMVSWLPHINDKNVLFLTYEEMYNDLEEAVREIGLFLGGRAAEVVSDPVKLEKVVAESRIDAMKQNQGRWFPGNALRHNFIRRGGSRDWKNYMTREQSDRMDRVFRARMANTVAETWWEYEHSWEDEVEIVLQTEAGEKEITEADELRSDSRASAYTPTPYIPERRNSFASVASSGYGSVWNFSHSNKQRDKSGQNDDDT